MEHSDVLSQLFKEYSGKKCSHIERITKAGSNRSYYRLADSDKTTHIVGTIAPNVDENKAFFYLTGHFRKKGLNVPEIFYVDFSNTIYLQEDLGSTSLYDYLKGARETGLFKERERELLSKIVHDLITFQFEGAEGMDFSNCYPVASFDSRSIFWDLNYFKYCFLKIQSVEFREDKLETDFTSLANILLKLNCTDTFMYRDFQSRNIMIKDGEPFYIDYQGGRKGPFYYDLVSFIWQSRALYPLELKEWLVKTYYDELKHHINIEWNVFNENLRYFVLFRLIQVLGAYGFRGLIENNPLFISAIPSALNLLDELLKTEIKGIPYLSALIRKVIDNAKPLIPSNSSDNLTVHITSFSFKKGIPADNSGNGGGFVFDCRSLNNPGRHEEYKALTGRDEAVIEFLDTQSDMPSFMNNVYALIDKSVENYIERKFSNLMVSFGCTGGQHRSVYGAEHLACHLKEKYKINIELFHRELDIHKHFPSK